MTDFFRNIIILLAVSAVLFSCSKAFTAMDASDSKGGRIIITGTVSELESAQPLKDMKIVFKAYTTDNAIPVPVYSDEVYSGNDGVYAIEAAAEAGKLRCVITASDMSGGHSSQTHEIMVTWSGPSYDKHSNSFIVNDCNFQLPKVRTQAE